ncbi:DUF721 domain-containing protein [candidate division WOR-3 bacterium]|nr:DUF721 domain-containing protein [candidate division WOR-3 bacterium]
MQKKLSKTDKNRYRKTLWVNDIIADVLGNIFDKSEEGVAGVLWSETIGPPINLHTKPLFTKGGVLTVEVENPVWRQQLEFLKEEIMTKLNKKLPQNKKISKIKFTDPKARFN